MSQTEDKLLFASDIGHIFFATSLQPITCKGADNLSIFFSTRTTTTFFKLTQPSATVFIHGETILHTYSRTNHSHWKVLFMRVFPTLEGNHRWTKKKNNLSDAIRSGWVEYYRKTAYNTLFGSRGVPSYWCLSWWFLYRAACAWGSNRAKRCVWGERYLKPWQISQWEVYKHWENEVWVAICYFRCYVIGDRAQEIHDFRAIRQTELCRYG